MSDLRISLPNPCSENWGEMQPLGCNRFCATCSETIHNLSELTAEETEALLRKPGKHCVRAQVRPDGALALRQSRSGNPARILVAVGASFGLLTSACETLPQTASPTGVIVGKFDVPSGMKSVRAISDDGRSHRAKIFADGSYRFKPLPYGSYALKFSNDCGSWEGGRVVLQESVHSVNEPLDTQECLVIGMAEVEDHRA
ncbi:MAG: hypothetical protein ACXW3D_04560 [Caulobacteraceae bacterium]